MFVNAPRALGLGVHRPPKANDGPRAIPEAPRFIGPPTKRSSRENVTEAQADLGPTEAAPAEAGEAPLQTDERQARPPLVLAGFCVIVWAVGCGLVLFGVSLITLGGRLGVWIGAPVGTAWAPLGLFFIAQGALALFAGLGLWRRRSWAWWLAWLLAFGEFQTAWPDGPVRVAVSVSLFPYLFAVTSSVQWPSPAVRSATASWVRRIRSAIRGGHGFHGLEVLFFTFVWLGVRVMGEAASFSLFYKLLIVSLVALVGLFAVAVIARVWGFAGPQRALKP